MIKPDALSSRWRIFPWRLVCLIAAMSGTGAPGAEFHISPAGAPEGDGSATRPWDIRTAFSHPKPVRPGDTLWLHGGAYRGSFESLLAGTAGAPVRVRQAPGERATIQIERTEGLSTGLNIRGEHAWYEGFEVSCDHRVRETRTTGSWPSDLQRGSVDVRGSHIRLINLVIHDLGSGSGFWREGEGGEIYGCLIYNNGWMAPDRSHGHGIYTQNERGIKTIADTVIFRQFGEGVHLYGSGNSSLRGFHLDGVVSFGNGRPGQTRDLLAGGGAPLDDIVIEHCHTRDGGAQIGYAADAANRSVIVRDNVFAGGLRLQYPGDYRLERNKVVAPGTLFTIQLREGQRFGRISIDGNAYFKTAPEWNPFAIYSPEGNRAGDLGVLQAEGFDARSAFSAASPDAPWVFVRPNRHQPGRAHVIVHNWSRAGSIVADLSGVLERGQAYRIVHVQNFFGEPVAKGAFDGQKVKIPMASTKAEPPVGMENETEMTDPGFGVFVVLPSGD